jgi:putative flippase GtrA
LSKDLIIKFFKFLLAGLPAFLVAIPLNYLLVSHLNFYKPLAYVIVLFIQVSINFFIVRRFVFHTKGKEDLLNEYYKFFVGISFFRFLDWGLYSIVVSLTPINYLIVQLGNVVIFSIAKFLYSKKILEK